MLNETKLNELNNPFSQYKHKYYNELRNNRKSREGGQAPKTFSSLFRKYSKEVNFKAKVRKDLDEVSKI